jgi:hypothetical protein
MLVILLISICIPLLWLSLSAFEPSIVLFQARRIAGDRPYCIVVPDKYGLWKYNTVLNSSDLTFTALTTSVDWGGSGGPKDETYYSLLILKNPDEIKNWSKSYLNWESDVNPMQMSLFRKDLKRLCTPVVNFAGTVR